MRADGRLARLAVLLALTAGPGLAAAASPPTSPPTAPPTSSATTPTAVDPGTEAQATPDASDVPELPFDDNPDPDQCGIPQPLGDDVRGEVTGRWQGELLFGDVHLYDSHLRAEVTGTVPDGSAVQVLVFQNNPVLNYWFVRWEGPEGAVEGWLPEPFLLRDRRPRLPARGAETAVSRDGPRRRGAPGRRAAPATAGRP